MNVTPRVVFLTLLFTSQILFAQNYYFHDFRDANSSYKLNAVLDVKSDNLPLDFFESDWKDYDKRKKDNSAFGVASIEVSAILNNFTFGVFRQKTSNIYMNNGLIETIYESDKSFSNILGNSDIYKNLEDGPIRGKANDFDSFGVFFEKKIKLKKYHYLMAKLKLHYATGLNNIHIKGHTTDSNYKATVDYYYSDKNLLSNAKNQSSDTRGYGYTLDVSYIYQQDKIYFFLGAYNLASYIYWKNISLMHYDLDSETIYVGEDGYNHYKPFGVGYYKYNIGYKQKVPSYLKSSINYDFMSHLAFGDNISIYDKMHYNELYTNLKVGPARYKLGYVVENYNLIFGFYYKKLLFEMSRGFELSNKILQFKCEISY
jgi:hypothetical protein